MREITNLNKNILKDSLRSDSKVSFMLFYTMAKFFETISKSNCVEIKTTEQVMDELELIVTDFNKAF